MLMTLLPFAGWAADVEAPAGFIDLSDGWSIRLTPAAQTYTGVAATSKPTIVLVKAKDATDTYVLSTGFNVAWDETPLNVKSGGYTATVTADDTRTYGELAVKTAKFHLMKATSTVTGAAAVQQANWTYNTEAPAAKPALTTPVSVTFGTVEYSIDNKATWSSTIPTITNVGEYYVWYRVQGNNNYNGINATKVSNTPITVSGTNLVVDADYSLPAVKTGLVFSWNNGAVAKDLITEGTVAAGKGTMKYRFKNTSGGSWSAWSASVPKASNAGTYAVEWMIEGATGYYDVAAAALTNVTIAAMTPTTVNPATGLANLVYAGTADPYQSLLSAGGSASDGATSAILYKVRYKADAETAWGAQAWLQEDVADYADIKGSNAGVYQIVAYVPTAGNYNVKESTPIEVVISPAAAYTAAPSAKDLTWNNDNQVLVNAATDAVTGTVEYLLDTDITNDVPDGTSWVTSLATIVGKNAGTYHVWYRVINANYQLKAATKIVVTIKRRSISVKVNDITKVFDNSTTLTNVAYYTEAECNTANASIAGFVTAGTTFADVTGMTAANGYSTDYVANTTGLAADDVYKYNTEIGPARNDANYKTTATVKTPANYTVDGDLPRFTFITPITGAHAANDFSALDVAAYSDIASSNKNAGPHAGVVTIAENLLTAINTANTYFYDYTIVPGKLTVSPRPIYVEANDGLTTVYGTALDISRGYTIKGGEAGPVNAATANATTMSKYFSTAPILTAPDAEGTYPAVNTTGYSLEFTAGTTQNNYKMDTTMGENHDGYYINGKKFSVTPDPEKKLVITVLPQTQEYTGVAESWANPVQGTHYVVSGLMDGDEFTAPTLSRSDATNFNVGEYVLSATGATVTNKDAHYPGGIVYNNSTFTITPAELTATVDQQTIYVGGVVGDIEQTSWDVTGLVGPDATTGKSVLGGTLAFNTTVGTATEKADATTAGLYTKGIKLNITNGNYTLKGATKDDADNKYYVYGPLRVITAQTIELDPTNAELAQLIEAKKYVDAAPVKYNVTFAHKSLKANTWYTMVLPFEVKTAELVTELKAGVGTANERSVYAIVNRMNESTTADKINFTLEMMEIPANEPFLIKVAENVNLQDVTFKTKKIISTDDPSKECAGNEFIGTYSAVTNLPETYNTTDKHWAFLATGHKGSKGQVLANTWWNANLAGLVINPMEAYLHYAYNATGAAPVITIEDYDFETGTTAIKTLNAETMKAYSVDGWYTLNGVKLQGVPTEKGIYINNGKKVVIK